MSKSVSITLGAILVLALLIAAASLVHRIDTLATGYGEIELEKSQASDLILATLKAESGIREILIDLAPGRDGTQPAADRASLSRHYRHLALVLAPLQQKDAFGFLPEAEPLRDRIFAALSALKAAIDLPRTATGEEKAVINSQTVIAAASKLRPPLHELAYYLAEVEKSSLETGGFFFTAVKSGIYFHLVALAVPIAGILFLAFFRRRRETGRRPPEAHEEDFSGLDSLKSAIESLPEGFALFDPEDRLVLCNDGYREMYGSKNLRIEPGVRYEDIFRAGAESGLFLGTEGNTESWLIDALKRHRKPTGSYKTALSDGRIIRVNERKVRSGGIVGIHTDITGARKNAGDADHSHPLPDENPEPILRISKEGEIVNANPASAELLRLWDTDTGGFAPDPIRKKVADALKSGRPLSEEVICGGDILSLSFSPSPLDDALNVYGRTVTGQKNLENFLRDIVQNLGRKTGGEFFNELMKILCQATGAEYAFIGEIDKKGSRESIKTSAFMGDGRILDNFECDLTGEPCRDVFDKETIIINGDLGARYPESSLPANWAARSYAGAPLFTVEGHRLGVLAVFSKTPFTNIDQVRSFIEIAADRAGAELQRFKASEESASMLAIPEHNPNPLIRVSGEGTIIFANPPARPILEHWERAAGEKLPEEMQANIREAVAHKKPIRFNLAAQEQIFAIQMVPTEKEDCLYLYATDVTELLRAEEALKRLSQQTEMILNSAGEGIVGLDTEGRTTFCNPSVQSITGWSPAELVGNSLHDIIHHAKENGDPYPKEECPTFQAITSGQGLRQESDLFWRKDGASFPVEYSCSPIEKDGKIVGSVLIFRDVSELKSSLAATSEREERLRAIVETSVDAIITIGEDGTVESFNKAAEKAFGYKAGEVIGNNVNLLMPSPYQEQHDGYLAHYLETGEKKIIGIGREVAARHKDGRIFPIELAVSEVSLGDRRLFTGLIRDITERKEHERQLEKARDEAQAASSAKSEFLAVMSHEVRTPLNGVLGMLELLEDSGLSAAQEDFVRIATDSGKALMTILNDILDFSKMDAGHLDLTIEPINVENLVEGIIQLLAPHAVTKNVELNYLIPPNMPRNLMGDGGRIRQVLLNLVGNAIKFTPQGEVGVTITIEEDTPEKSTLRFDITDTGIGIPEENKKHMFEEFSQADPSYARRFGGTGLGLAISKKILAAMNGEIRFSSAPGKGSHFWFTLPLDKRAGVPETSTPHPSFAGLRILVDSVKEMSRKRLETTLSFLGAEVAATGGEEDIFMILEDAAQHDEKIDLVITDNKTMGHSDPQMVRKIHDDPRLGNIKMILLTNKNPMDMEPPAEGFDLVLAKPVLSATLLNGIAELTGRKVETGLRGDPLQNDEYETNLAERSVMPRGLSEDAPPALAEKEPPSSEAIRVLLVEDSPVNQLVAMNMLASMGFAVTCAADGRAAVEKVKENLYDVILMDLSMPNMDGLAATMAIRGLANGKSHIPIIAMTANVMEGDQKKCLDAGMNDYLGKPFDKQTLRLMLEKWAKTGTGTLTQSGDARDEENREQKTTPQPQKTEKSGEEPHTMEETEAIHWEALRQLEEDVGPEIVPKLVSRFLEETSIRVKKISRAAQERDFDALRNEAHTLKSSTWAFGVRKLSEQIKLVETACRQEDFEKALEFAQPIEGLAGPALQALKKFLEEAG